MPIDIMSSEPRHWMAFGQLVMPAQCCAGAQRRRQVIALSAYPKGYPFFIVRTPQASLVGEHIVLVGVQFSDYVFSIIVMAAIDHLVCLILHFD